MGLYQMINLFFLYSFLGYLLECAVLSFENRRPVIDRGFGHGPFCVIYGVGALGAYILLSGTVHRFHGNGNDHGVVHGQHHDPPVRGVLVGLQPKAV